MKQFISIILVYTIFNTGFRLHLFSQRVRIVFVKQYILNITL